MTGEEVIKQIEDLFEGNINGTEPMGEYSHMTGDILLCGRTADEAIRRINERKAKEGK